MTRIMTPTKTPTNSDLARALLSRRALCTGLVSGFGATMLPLSAFAMSESSTAKLVQDLMRDVYKVIESGKSESAMLRDFERIFDRYADVPIIARSALGADARRATSSQLSAFTKAFRVDSSRK